MSTLKLILPGGRSLRVSSPFSKETNKLSGLSLIINVISLTAVSLFAFLLPISGTLFSTDTETSSLKFLLIFVFAFLVIFLLKLLIQGNNFIIDPKGMLMILIFNLVLTTLSITITTLRVSSTFGTTGFRFLSGIALMSLIGLFYFLNLYAANNVGLKRLLNFISAGTVLYVLLYLLSVNQTNNQFISNLPLITIGLSILIYRVLKSQSKRLGSISVLVMGLLILVAIPFNDTTYSSLFFFTFALFIATTLVIALYVLKNKTYLKTRIKIIKANVISFINVKKISIPNTKGLADLHLIVVLILPIFLLLTSVFFYIKIPELEKPTFLTEISTEYTDGIRIIMAGSNTITGNNLRTIVMGVGNDNYNPARSFFVNVLIVSGLVGSVIYLVLWGYFIKAAKDLFSRSFKEKKDSKILALLLFSVILIPLILLTSFSNLTTVILLWILYAVISSMQSKFDINYLDNKIATTKPKLISVILRTLLTLALIVGIIYSLTIIFGVIK